MKLNELKPYPGSTKKPKRIGRGEGSGHGGSATKGTKGQRARSGDGKLIGFEGGQMPLIRRIPKRGFSNRRFERRFTCFNLGSLDKLFKKRKDINPATLRLRGLIKTKSLVKVLSDGKLTRPLNIKAHAFSKTACEKIKKAGGEYEVLKS